MCISVQFGVVAVLMTGMAVIHDAVSDPAPTPVPTLTSTPTPTPISSLDREGGNSAGTVSSSHVCKLKAYLNYLFLGLHTCFITINTFFSLNTCMFLLSYLDLPRKLGNECISLLN